MNPLKKLSLRNPKNFRTCEPFKEKFSNATFFRQIASQNLQRKICNAKTLGFLRLKLGKNETDQENMWEKRVTYIRQPILILGQKCGTTFCLRYPELFQDGPMNLAKTHNCVTGWIRCRLELFNDKFKLNLKFLTNKNRSGQVFLSILLIWFA